MFLLKNLYRVEKNKFGLRINLKTLTDKVEEIGKGIFEGAEFTKPTLLLRGAYSDYVLDSDFEMIKKHFPNSEIKTVDNASHWLHAENPKDFYDYSANFINS